MIIQAPPRLSLDEIKAAARQVVNGQAAVERDRYRTPEMSETYAQKQRDVDAWNDNRRQAEDIPYAARRAARRNGISKLELHRLTPPQLAAVIAEYKTAIASLRVIDLDIEDERERVNELIVAATDAAQVAAALASLNWPVVPG
jgi:hypothetical protein